MADEDFAAVDVDVAVVGQRLQLAINELVEVVGQRDAGQFLDGGDGVFAGVEKDFLVVDVDGHAVVVTVFLVVVILYAVGGQGIHGFAFALVIGTISGTYSTIYIATPALIWLNNMSHRAQAGAQVPRRTPQTSGSR